MLIFKRLTQIIGAGTVAFMLAASPLLVQAEGTSKSTQAGTNGTSDRAVTTGAASTTNGAANGAVGADNGAANGASARSARISEEDQQMMKDIAEANLAEIRTGNMVLRKPTSKPEVRQFAQMMINDHTKAYNELQKLAKSKGVTLPKETDIQHKALGAGLGVLTGDTFDKAYISWVGQSDHERTRELLQNTMQNARDPQLRAYAKKTLQTVNQHKQKADAIEKKMEARDQ